MGDPCSSVFMGTRISPSLSWVLFFDSLTKLNHACMVTVQDSCMHSSLHTASLDFSRGSVAVVG